MNTPLHFDDLNVGDLWQSEDRTVTEADVADFAALTGDHNPLHTDDEYARRTPFRRPIAHGLLGLSLAAGLSNEHPNVRTDAFVGVHQWRFLRPVFFGDKVRAVAEVIEKGARTRRRGRVLWKRYLLNQNDEVVQEGIFETLVAVARPRESSSSRDRLAIHDAANTHDTADPHPPVDAREPVHAAL
jgi:acyl dehydratase